MKSDTRNTALEQIDCASSHDLQDMECGRRIVCNGSLNLAAQMLFALLQLLLVFFLARDLGKADLGEYFTLVTVVLIVQLITESGTATLLTQRIASDPDDWRNQVAQAAGIFTLVSTASAVVLVLVIGLWNQARGSGFIDVNVLCAAVACAAIQWQRFVVGVFQAFELFIHENLARILQGGLLVVGVMMLHVLSEPAIKTVIILYAGSHVLTCLYLLVRLRRFCGQIDWRLNVGIVREWMQQAIPLGWGDGMRKLMWQIDTLVLFLLTSPVHVGVYSVAFRALSPLNWIPRALLSAAFPAVARHAVISQVSVRCAFARGTRFMVVASLPLAIGVSVAARPIITTLAGASYAESAQLLQILIWIILLSFVSLQFRFFLTAVGQQRHYARIVAVALVIKIAVLLTIVPLGGCTAACVGSLIVEALFAVLGIEVCARLGLASFDGRHVARAVVAACPMAFLAWLGRDWGLVLLMPWLTFAGVVYLAGCLGLGVFKSEEVRHASGFLDRLRRRIGGSHSQLKKQAI